MGKQLPRGQASTQNWMKNCTKANPKIYTRVNEIPNTDCTLCRNIPNSFRKNVHPGHEKCILACGRNPFRFKIDIA